MQVYDRPNIGGALCRRRRRAGRRDQCRVQSDPSSTREADPAPCSEGVGHTPPCPDAGRRAACFRIRSDDAVSYAAARQPAGASNAQVNRELQALKRILSLAVRHGNFPSKPPIALLREDNVRTGFLDAAQVASICKHLEP